MYIILCSGRTLINQEVLRPENSIPYAICQGSHAQPLRFHLYDLGNGDGRGMEKITRMSFIETFSGIYLDFTSLMDQNFAIFTRIP